MSNNGVLQAKNTKYLPANTTTYNVTQDDDFIYVDTSLNAVEIILPNIRNGALTENPKCFKINDYSGNANVNNITIKGCGGDSVNSAVSFVMSTSYESIETNVVNLDEWFVGSSAGQTPVTGFVPYVGATANVNLGLFNITTGSDSYFNTVRVGLGGGSVATNTAIGFQALNINTSGSLNTAVGYNALALNLVGLVNTAVGNSSFGVNIGSSNTGLGYNTGRDNTSGGNNTYIGESAGRGNIIGSGNTAVGKAAGLNALGDGNVFLGLNAGRYETGSNSFYVNNRDLVNTATDKIGSLIYGQFNGTITSQNVTINANLMVATTSATPQSGQRVFSVNQDTAYASIGSLVGSTSNAAMYMNTSTPSGINYTLRVNTTNTYLSAQGGITSNLHLLVSGNERLTINGANSNLSRFIFTPAVTTSNAASTELPGLSYESQTTSWTAGALTTQRFLYFKTQTLAFASASTATNAYGAYFEAATAGAHATITNNYALGLSGDLRIITGSVANQGIVISSAVGSATYGAIYMGVTPSSSNFAILSNGSGTYLNGSTVAELDVANSTKLQCGATTSYMTTKFYIGAALTPTAVLHLAAGTTNANTAPLKFTSGVNLGTAEAGAMEYNGVNLFFTRTGTTRQTVLTANIVTTEVVVSDTTITVNVNGTDYKLLARA